MLGCGLSFPSPAPLLEQRVGNCSLQVRVMARVTKTEGLSYSCGIAAVSHAIPLHNIHLPRRTINSALYGLTFSLQGAMAWANIYLLMIRCRRWSQLSISDIQIDSLLGTTCSPSLLLSWSSSRAKLNKCKVHNQPIISDDARILRLTSLICWTLSSRSPRK
jgi:hypothetical protein